MIIDVLPRTVSWAILVLSPSGIHRGCLTWPGFGRCGAPSGFSLPDRNSKWSSSGFQIRNQIGNDRARRQDGGATNNPHLPNPGRCGAPSSLSFPFPIEPCGGVLLFFKSEVGNRKSEMDKISNHQSPISNHFLACTALRQRE